MANAGDTRNMLDSGDNISWMIVERGHVKLLTSSTIIRQVNQVPRTFCFRRLHSVQAERMNVWVSP